MVDTAVDKFSSLVGPNFIVAYWGPSAVGLGLVLGLISIHVGLPSVFDWWGKQSVVQQVTLELSLCYS